MQAAKTTVEVARGEQAAKEIAHFEQQCDFIGSMLSGTGRIEVERLRAQHPREEERRDQLVKYVTLRRRSDGVVWG